MRFDIVTIFPEFFRGPLDHGIVRRAREAGLVEIRVQDLREFARDPHRTVDDRPFGGGEGMVFKPEPLFDAVESLLGITIPPAGVPRASRAPHASSAAGPESAVADRTAADEGWEKNAAIVLLSASGKLFRQADARRLASLRRIILLCGRYEGVDERVAERLATEELSIGDLVLSGGELPAALVVDAVTRLLPGALGNQASSVQESFSEAAGERRQTTSEGGPAEHWLPSAGRGILDCPHYTRPQEYRGWTVPEVLVSGNHEQIRRWRRKMALAKTLRNRPDLLATSALSAEDHRLLDEVRSEKKP